MPPRSAKRKKPSPASARATKLTRKLEELDVELNLVDQRNAVSELQGNCLKLEAVEGIGNQQEGVSSAAEDKVGEQTAHSATGRQEIKQEAEGLKTNCTEDEALQSGGERKVVVSTPVEAKVKEEMVEEERNVEGLIVDHVNVNTERFIRESGVAEDRERPEGVQSESGCDKNENASVEDETEKCDNANEDKGVEGEQNEGRPFGGDRTQLGTYLEQNSCEEGTAAARVNDAEVLGDCHNDLVLYEGSDGAGGDEGAGEENTRDDEGENEDEEHLTILIADHIIPKKKEKDLEIHIGRLDKRAVEDDLINVFGKFGEIKVARIVRNPITNKSRGFAFIQYATAKQTKNALCGSKDGIKVRGKHVKISVSRDNTTLYLGYICKLWTKDRVLETLKDYGITNIEEIHLPDDPQKDGKIKGFALLEFSTHSDAMAAFQRLRKPDAVFGRDRSAKIAFAQTPMHPSEEILSQVKTVYVEGLTDAWNDEEVKEMCQQYGEVVKLKLSRTLGSKRKDFGFVTFSSRESALACMEGINNAQIGNCKVKIKASIAKPHFKGRLQKQGTRGGFRVTENISILSTKEESERGNEASSSKMKGLAKSKEEKKKGKMVAGEKGKALSNPEIGGGGKVKKTHTVTEGQCVTGSSKLDTTNRKRKNQHLKAEGRGNIGAEHGHNRKPSKKPRGTKRERQRNNFKKPKRNLNTRERPKYDADFIRRGNPFAPGYVASAVSYQSHANHAHNTMSVSKRPYADMEPHAGYLEPFAQEQGHSYSDYLEATGGLQYQPHAGFLRSSTATQSHPTTGYQEPDVGKHGRPHAAFFGPAAGMHGQTHAGYLEPRHAGYHEFAVAECSHDPHGLALRRAGGENLHGGRHSAYGTGSSLPPSYAMHYTKYAGYEEGSSGGRRHYLTTATHLSRRVYY